MSALNKYKVLELSEGVSGEYCSKLLADFGADVIKIERHGSGSPTRRMAPLSDCGGGHESSGLFAYLNTNKHSVELDISSDVGIATLQRLIEKVDIVIDDHPDGWLKAVGLDPETFNQRWPKVVLCSITAYGQNPPDNRKHAEDLTVFHSSGWGYHTPGGGYDDRPPLKGPGRFLVSYEAALDAAMCVVSALYEREESGLGQFIDVSMNEVMASRSDYVLAQFANGDMDVRLERDALDLRGPAGTYPCRDGFVYMWMATPNEWAAFQQLLGNPDCFKDYPPTWLMMELTPERIAESRRYLREWLETRGKDEAAAQAQKLGLPLVAVNNPRDLESSPQYIHRRYFTELEHPALGKTVYPTVPYKMSETPVRIVLPAPLLGEHTRQRLADIEGDLS